ncbi:inner membrane ABC transporter permease ydcU domain protein [Escherichia coli 5-366-08_S4_C1]|nr:inner membrane ABC transporter permease ydcU domain protein [Escherichia coli 5-366-08_S4_C1]
MAMNVLQSPSRPGLGKVSGFFWHNPGLGLFLLLLGPLMWFGIVYFGSLLTLLWQGFFTFYDFTNVGNAGTDAGEYPCAV